MKHYDIMTAEKMADILMAAQVVKRARLRAARMSKRDEQGKKDRTPRTTRMSKRDYREAV